jgi:hypothetical protein
LRASRVGWGIRTLPWCASIQPAGIVAAQHLEGGPEAQLYLHVGDVEMELFGSYETNFREDDDNEAPWPIPNVLGVRPKASKSK